jgi:outer membrane receptor protein involved in Fe transport
MKLTRFLGATALAGTLLSIPAVAWAQDSTQASGTLPQDDNSTPSRTEDTTILVTGSRIAAPNTVSASPITSVSATELQATAKVSIGDVLNDLPQLQSTFSQANSTRFLGTGGLNLLDLYGLGTQRTLVLVNGRRHVGADILNNAVSPDTNTFPTDLIERVDISTGGDSAVYGSDAIAGVVNFVLKDSFDGIQFRAQGGLSDQNDAASYSASLLAGKNFAEGRGNIAVDLEYARQNAFFASDRRTLSQNNGFVTVDSDTAGTASGFTTPNTDGTPDAVFFRDIRSATLNFGGLVAIPGIGNRCGVDNLNRAFTCNYIFNPDGSLVAQTGTRVGLSSVVGANATPTPGGSFIGGNGDTRRDGPLIQILPELNRYSANLIGHFDISPAFTPFVEAKYVRTESFSQGGSGPAFFTGSTIDAFAERPRLDNPYLSAQARSTLATQLTSVVNAGINPTTGATLTPAQQAATLAAINDGSYRFILRRNLIDLGYRSEAATRETYRIVGGVRGDFNGDWHYEVSANYGEFDERTKILGNVNVQRELLALDAQRNAAGQIVCASQIPGARGTASAANATTWNDDPSNLIAADVAACVPYNPFGLGNNAAARAYIAQDTVSRGKITQFDALASLAGDTSGFFNLPGGPVGFAIGAEYRRETNFFAEDPLVENGYTFYNAIARFDPPAFEVKEAFGEIRVPLLKDLPFASELTLIGAGRVSDYKGSAGTVYAYNGGITYAPIKDITFRGTYSRSVRAPNLSELYSAQSQNFAPGFADPCSARNLAGGTQYRAANCAAAGIPATYDFVYAQSLGIVSGGNPDLDVETSDSFTGGILLQPQFVPGLSISADYYNITVNNVITSVSAQSIVNNCYDSPTLSNPFCGSFTRVAAGGTGPRGEQAFRIIEGSLLQSVLNFAKLKVSGINATLAYSHRFGDVLIGSKVDYTHQLHNETFTNPSDPAFGDNLLGEVGIPKDAVNWNIDADFGDFFVNTQFRYLSKMALGAIENHQSYQGRAPQNLDDFDIAFYPDVFYMNTRFGINIQKNGTFYFGIDNVTNRVPPLGSTGIGGGSAIYEPVGRRYYAGITAKF